MTVKIQRKINFINDCNCRKLTDSQRQSIIKRNKGVKIIKRDAKGRIMKNGIKYEGETK